MTNDRLRILTDRYVRMLEEMDERKADIKEIELEAKALGFNVRQFKEWAKAEHTDKVAKKIADAEDAVLYGEGLGHNLGCVLDSDNRVHSNASSEVKE